MLIFLDSEENTSTFSFGSPAGCPGVNWTLTRAKSLCLCALFSAYFSGGFGKDFSVDDDHNNMCSKSFLRERWSRSSFLLSSGASCDRMRSKPFGRGSWSWSSSLSSLGFFRPGGPERLLSLWGLQNKTRQGTKVQQVRNLGA